MTASERPPREVPDARSVAARVLERVERDGAYAAAALDTEIQKNPQLDVRDRGLATEIVYGVLRTRRALLSRLEARAPRGLPEDTRIRAHFLVAAYQILLLDRVPAHAAVDAAVNAIKALRGDKVAGFANAVLRKIATGPGLGREEAVLENVPPWLLDELTHAVGKDGARALLGAVDAGELDVNVAIRLVGNKYESIDWLRNAEKGRSSPIARLVPRGGSLAKREGYAEGAFVVQDEGAQLVALALGARPGERVLDACAGRGQKTTLLREQVGPTGDLWAADLYAEKLTIQGREMGRLGLVPARTAAVDLSIGTGELPGNFDRVLVDAPCTGTGTLRRRPEILLRLGPDDPARLAVLSEAILRRAGSLARPGGRVVFAVCSVVRAECEAVVDRVSDLLEPAPFDAPALSTIMDSAGGGADATELRLSPDRHATDGFYVKSLIRRQ
ncbi:MAG TPA: transcription antitermination factor NusB [Polyangiaceae bacterium]|nr:transcription antitermination factor NusB [Polyangiaceae bacterium]